MFRRFFSRRKKRLQKSLQKSPRLRFTVDHRTQKNLSRLDPAVQPIMREVTQIAKGVAKTFNLDVSVISGYRSYEEQAALYAKGRTAPGSIVTYAKPGFSNHNFGTAIDFGIFAGGKYLDSREPGLTNRVYQAIWNNIEAEGLPIEWGGNWKRLKDTPHFEYRTGLSLAEMRERKEAGLPIVT
jgi:peptidoglycan L-alanyl-D-glutamate endopeptidase CwlK